MKLANDERGWIDDSCFWIEGGTEVHDLKEVDKSGHDETGFYWHDVRTTFRAIDEDGEWQTYTVYDRVKTVE